MAWVTWCPNRTTSMDRKDRKDVRSSDGAQMRPNCRYHMNSYHIISYHIITNGIIIYIYIMLYQFISLPMELLHIYHAASIHIIPNKNYCIYIMLYQFISYHIISLPRCSLCMELLPSFTKWPKCGQIFRTRSIWFIAMILRCMHSVRVSVLFDIGWCKCSSYSTGFRQT